MFTVDHFCLATSSCESTETYTCVGVDSIITGKIIVTRVTFTLVCLSLTDCTCEPRLTYAAERVIVVNTISIFTRVAIAFIDVCFTSSSSESLSTDACQPVYIIYACSTILTRTTVTFIHICFTCCPSETCNTAACEPIYMIYACSTILTRTTVTFIHICFTCCSSESCNTAACELIYMILHHFDKDYCYIHPHLFHMLSQ